MALKPEDVGVWLFRDLTKDLGDEVLVGLSAPVAPKSLEETATLIQELKLQEMRSRGRPRCSTKAKGVKKHSMPGRGQRQPKKGGFCTQ